MNRSRSFEPGFVSSRNKESSAPRVRAEDAIEEDYRQEVDRVRCEILANMSHELRTPLNGIIGFSELLYSESLALLSGEQKVYLHDILLSAKQLLEMVNNMLELANIETQNITFAPQPIQVAAVVAEIEQLFRPWLQQKQLNLRTELDPALPTIISDPGKLKQILYCYLSNAIKFSNAHNVSTEREERGQIILRIFAVNARFFRLEVEDSGCGIEVEDFARLFLPFQQLDSSICKRHQGLGLGLVLARRLSEAQGGSNGVSSLHGQGSLFFSLLPRVLSEGQPARK